MWALVVVWVWLLLRRLLLRGPPFRQWQDLVPVLPLRLPQGAALQLLPLPLPLPALLPRLLLLPPLLPIVPRPLRLLRLGPRRLRRRLRLLQSKDRCGGRLEQEFPPDSLKA